MIDASEVERQAMRRCLKDFGSAAERVGFTKPLAEYSESEAMIIIDAIVTGYTTAMAEHHEGSRHPPFAKSLGTSDPTSPESDAFFDDPIPF